MAGNNPELVAAGNLTLGLDFSRWQVKSSDVRLSKILKVANGL